MQIIYLFPDQGGGMVIDLKLLKFQKARSTPFSRKAFALENKTENSDSKLTLSVEDSDSAA